MSPTVSDIPQLLDVPKTAEAIDGTESSVRRLIFHDTDGFASKCVVRLGRKVRIRADRLAEFIDERTGAEPFRFKESWYESEKRGRPKARKANQEAGR